MFPAFPDKLLAVLVIGTGLLSGCSAPQAVQVRPAPAPLPTAALPALDTDRIQQLLVPAEAVNLPTEQERRLVSAREAFWNRETDKAVAILKELIAAAPPKIDTNHLRRLIGEFYEEDGRWGEAADQWAAMGTAPGRVERQKFAQFMAGLPRRTISFVPDAGPIPMELKRGQLVKARAKINGTEAVVFIDTGFTGSLVSEGFARRAGIEIHSQTIGMTDSNRKRREVQMVSARGIEIGGLKAENVPMIMSPLLFLDNLVGDVDAVIGWDLLQHADVTWNFPATEMTLKQPSGPPVTEPNLTGRRAPMLRVLSAEGRRLDLFLDTGYESRPPTVSLVANADLLFTKLDGRQAGFRWRPQFSMGMNSFRVKWPRQVSPFEFWFDGQIFTIPLATVSRSVDVREGLQTCDGMIGNSPFLSGTLRVCGVQRLASFTPGATSR